MKKAGVSRLSSLRKTHYGLIVKAMVVESNLGVVTVIKTGNVVLGKGQAPVVASVMVFFTRIPC